MTHWLCPLVDLYRTSRAWSSTASFADVDGKSGVSGDGDDDLAGSGKETEFRGVHRVLDIYPVRTTIRILVLMLHLVDLFASVRQLFVATLDKSLCRKY
jgi:hypothetical protein